MEKDTVYYVPVLPYPTHNCAWVMSSCSGRTTLGSAPCIVIVSADEVIFTDESTEVFLGMIYAIHKNCLYSDHASALAALLGHIETISSETALADHAQVADDYCRIANGEHAGPSVAEVKKAKGYFSA